MLILIVCLWLFWWLGGLWLTIRAVTKRRDFHAVDLPPLMIACAIAGPIVALIWVFVSRNRVLFKKRN